MSLMPLPDTVAERTVPQLLAAVVAEVPERDALIAASLLAGGQEVRLTYAELAQQAFALAGALRQRGVRPGDRVVIMLRNTGSIEAHLAYHAAHRLGAIAVPVNTLYVGRELAYVLEFARPAAVVIEPAFVEMVRAGLPDGCEPALLISGEPTDGGESLAAALGGDHESAEQAALTEHDVADWIFTSGTTGHPKAVEFTHAAAVACGYEAVHLWDIDGMSVYQNAGPFFTSTGCHTNQLACLAARCTEVVDPEVDIPAILDRVVRCGTTHMFLLTPIAAMILRQLDDGRLASLELGRLRHINIGGQVMSKTFHERLEQLLAVERGIGIAGVYGLTEGGTSGLTFPAERHAEAVERVGPYGLPIGDRPWCDWIQYRIVDAEDNDVSDGEVGELLLRAPSVMSRYVGNPEATAQALRDGWLHTRDMVMRDDAGFIFFVDRDSLMIRRGGMNISSVEVEGLAAEHPAVEEAAAVPRPNPVLGEDVHLVVALRPGAEATEAELIEYLGGELASYKVPRSVSFVDALPRTAMNRVARAELKAMVQDSVSARTPGQ
jgi:acyl-CoA synthetase (AMP-forming)/AMP-acid ligase II